MLLLYCCEKVTFNHNGIAINRSRSLPHYAYAPFVAFCSTRPSSPKKFDCVTRENKTTAILFLLCDFAQDDTVRANIVRVLVNLSVSLRWQLSYKESLYISRAFAILNVILPSSKLRTNKIVADAEAITTKASLGGSSRVSWQCSLANLRACPVMRVAAIGGVRPTTSLTFLFDKLWFILEIIHYDFAPASPQRVILSEVTKKK